MVIGQRIRVTVDRREVWARKLEDGGLVASDAID